MGEENHNLCCIFFYKFCQITTLSLHLVNSNHHGAVGSASAWQTRGRGFEPVLMRYILAENIPVLSGRLVLITNVTSVFFFLGAILRQVQVRSHRARLPSRLRTRPVTVCTVRALQWLPQTQVQTQTMRPGRNYLGGGRRRRWF